LHDAELFNYLDKIDLFIKLALDDSVPPLLGQTTLVVLAFLATAAASNDHPVEDESTIA